VEFKKGRHLFHASDRASKVFFLQTGLVKVYHLSPGGLVTIFWFCSSGDLLGAARHWGFFSPAF
jgi:CRP-like cAMP-binding protein